jgi:hypothetical protein
MTTAHKIPRQRQALARKPRRIPVAALVALALIAVATLATPAPAPAEGCPNESLRAELSSGALPDCRAYERVTPAYTSSSILTGVFAASPEGSHVIGGSLGAFGGTNEDVLGAGENIFGAIYELSRTPGQGWSAEAVGPSSTEFAVNGMFDASEDLSETLWELGRIRVVAPGGGPEEARCPAPGELEEAQRPHVTDLYLERPHRAFVRIGPATPELCAANATPFVQYNYRGSSDDLSRVLFSTNPGYHWHFDGTIAPGGTLYEYVGVEKPGELRVEQSGEPERKPLLVGVEGESPLSKALISHCGTRLGSSSKEEGVNGSVYNAISASGTRVFFTAVGSAEASQGCEGPLWGELFAREEVPLVEGEVPAASIRTVSISQPTVKDCSRCIVTSEPQAPAVFQGASRDGSRVFFTTEQELLPGATGNNLYEYDFGAPAGERVRLLSGGVEPAEVQGVARISEDGSHVYFVARGDLTGAAKNIVGNGAEAGEDNLYVYSEGHVAFVAALSEAGDSANWAMEDNRPVLASENGDFLVFTSVADLTDEGLNGRPQIFQYDAVTGALVRVSIGEDGYGEDGRSPEIGSTLPNGFVASYNYSIVDSPTMAAGIQGPSDGVVFFMSPDALTPGALHDRRVKILEETGNVDEKPVPNVYEYRDGHVYLISDGRDVSAVNSSPSVYLDGWDPSGQDVFFTTADSLVPGDANTQQDLYDARVEGGFAVAPSPAGCGEACQGPLGGAPPLAPLGGSATQSPEPLVSPPAPAPKKTSLPLTRAQKLARALKACRKNPSKKGRTACERKARRTYGRVKA